MSEITLVADTREPEKIRSQLSLLCKRNDLEYTEAALEVGDLIIKQKDEIKITIERKRVTDLYHSMVSDFRLFSQLPLLMNARRPVVAITGTNRDLYNYFVGMQNISVIGKCGKCGYEWQTKMKTKECPKCKDSAISFDRAKLQYNPNLIRGIIASTIVRYGIEVWKFESDDEFLDILIRIAKKFGEGKEGIPWRVGKKTGSYAFDYAKVLFLCSITGITPSIAKKLLVHFKTIKNIINASKEELISVEGIRQHHANSLLSITGESYVSV